MYSMVALGGPTNLLEDRKIYFLLRQQSLAVMLPLLGRSRLFRCIDLAS